MNEFLVIPRLMDCAYRHPLLYVPTPSCRIRRDADGATPSRFE